MTALALTASASQPYVPPRIRRTAWVNRFGYAALASLFVHGLLIAFVPGFRSAIIGKPAADKLDIVIVPRKQVSPPPPVVQKTEPVAPAPVQPQAQPRRAEPREMPREVQPRIITAAPEAVAPGAAVVEPQRSVEPAPVPEVFKPAPPVEPVRATAPSIERPSDSMVLAYGNGFKSEVDKLRRYPRVAQARGWQGTATVLVKVLPGGRIADISIAQSSGFDMLDETARDMVKGAPLPSMPEPLRHHGFEMRIPVEFKLV